MHDDMFSEKFVVVLKSNDNKNFLFILCIVKWYFLSFPQWSIFFVCIYLKVDYSSEGEKKLLKSYEFVCRNSFRFADMMPVFSRQCSLCFIHFKFFQKWKCCNFGFLVFVVYIFDNVQDSLLLICRWCRRRKNIRKCLIQSRVFLPSMESN